MASMVADTGATAAADTAAAAATAEGEGVDKRTPTDFLKSVLGRPVVVKLNSGVDYRGTPCCGPPSPLHKGAT